MLENWRSPSYSTLRRTLLELDYEDYSARLASFFEITPIEGETLAVDGKVLKGSYLFVKNRVYISSRFRVRVICP